MDDAVAEIIVALVSKPKFATMMQEKINMKVDTSTIDQEVTITKSNFVSIIPLNPN